MALICIIAYLAKTDQTSYGYTLRYRDGCGIFRDAWNKRRNRRGQNTSFHYGRDIYRLDEAIQFIRTTLIQQSYF